VANEAEAAAARRIALYSAVGDQLALYHVDPAAGTMLRRSSVAMPSKVQYAWRHPTLPVWYVSTSSGGPRERSDHNHLSAWRMGPEGELSPLGPVRPLPARPVHICVHPGGGYVLSAHNYGAGSLIVHPIEPDGSLGNALEQGEALEFGIYPHQVMTLPGGGHALIVDRGNQPKDGRGEDPGALRTFSFQEGRLGQGQVVAPNGGYGFGPRHVAFHPSGAWMYVSDERFNCLHTFRISDGLIDPQPIASCPTLADQANCRPRQLAGPIHMHPLGKAVYVANRSDHSIERDGRPLYAGGENSIVVFQVDERTGGATPIQHVPTQSIHVRTFAIDPAGEILVTASIKGMDTERGYVGAALSLFRVKANGVELEPAGKVDVETQNNALHYWIGMTELPRA
jgi:6-phosphogluconolactonase (cycloisomerase 2 family)